MFTVIRQMYNLPESQVVGIWQHQLLDRTALVTEEGEPIEIIYPGRINDDRGADFRDAVIATSQGLVKGDVEVHVKSSGWRAHRHHQDPAYNRVILHVVMWHDTEMVTTLQNGERVPVLALHKYIRRPASLAYPSFNLNMLCHQVAGHLAPGIMDGFLDSAGEERFLAKAAGFQADLAQKGVSQCLYQGIMGALGYSRNKLPFMELARRLPVQILESLAQGKTSGEECLARQQALLLGTAGLLPSQRSHWHLEGRIGDEWVGKLEQLWTSSRRDEVMYEDDWRLFKVRPNNFPVRRIAAISYLIVRYREKGIPEEVVITNDYWASHFDFGSGSRIGIPALLGGSRAADIVINVLLPFTFAWGKFTSQPELTRKVLDLYCWYPRLVVNTLEKHMRNQLGLGSHLVNSARRQQGLIHIYKTLCSQGKCHCCPLGESSGVPVTGGGDIRLSADN